MSISGYIITGLVVAIIAIFGVGATYLNYERRKYERKLTEQAKESAATHHTRESNREHYHTANPCAADPLR